MTLGREGNRNVQTSQGSDVGSFPPALRLIFKMATNRMSDFARLSPEWITFECHAHDSSNFAEKVFSKPLATTRGQRPQVFADASKKVMMASTTKIFKMCGSMTNFG